MSSTTIRYSTLPENSHSISLSSAYPPPDNHHASPGAYRYDPDTYDPSVPDSDPRSPRYEPPHLRHRPGDTYEIGGKPHDPHDPGPYGTPGWYQDQRIGRHRRGELPDPLPAGHDDRQPTAGERPRPMPSPAPRQQRRRYWSEPEPETGTDESGRFDPEAEEPYRFSRLREDAWERWLIDSEPLAAAHRTGASGLPRPSGRADRIGPVGRNRRTAIDHECGPTIAAFIRLVQWIVAVIKGPATGEQWAEPAGPTNPPTDPPAGRPTGSPADPFIEPPTTPVNVSELETRARPNPIRPPHQLPLPRTGNGFIGSWELQFDARHTVTGGGLA